MSDMMGETDGTNPKKQKDPVVAVLGEKSKEGKRKKPYKSKSLVWDHFTKIISTEENKVERATCNYCGREFVCPSALGTSTLWRHLKQCSYYEGNKDPSQQQLSFSSSVDSHAQVVNWKFDQEHCRKELARMIIIDELPFSFVEKEGFKRFVNALQPKFHLMSRTTITKDCIEIYNHERKILKAIFQSSTSRVCLTTDLWTSIQNLGYMCLTAHYIDIDWKLQKKIINFCVLPTPHRGEVIAQAVEACLLEWQLEKLCTITVDNASSNDVATLSLKKKLVKRDGLLLNGDFFHVRCFAHILNLIVRDGIEEAKSSILALRDYVKYVRSSPSRLQLFKKCAEEERILGKRALCLDVQTRWNSTYLMLNNAIEYQIVFERLEDKDMCFKIEVKNAMTEEDWMTIKSLHKFLENFYMITKRVSGSKYVTSNSFFLEINRIQALLLSWANHENVFFSNMAMKMKLKFDKYCNIEKINPLLIVAVVLDPRYKLKYVKFSFTRYYQSHDVDAMISKVKLVMEQLYKYYSSSVLAFMENVGGSQGGKDIRMDDVGASTIGLDDHKEDWHEFLKAEQTVVIKSEFDRYLEDGVEDESQHFDILAWWKMKASTYRVLCLMARDILSIPISTVASESAFSTGGRVLDQFRSSLTPKIVESLICAQDWLRSSSTPIDVEEKLEDLEKIESTITDEIGALSKSGTTSSSNI